MDMDGFVVKALSLWEGARYEDRVGALGRKARWPVAKRRRELKDLKELEVVPEDEESLSVRSFRRNDLIARNISKGGLLLLERMWIANMKGWFRSLSAYDDVFVLISREKGSER